MKTLYLASAMIVAIGFLGQVSTYAQTADDVGKSLTPMGAIRAGNADGTIPAWSGGLAAVPAGWHQGDARPDPYGAERPLFSITAENLGRYQDKLAAGTVAMLRTLQGFRIDVYPSHRSFAAPQFIYDNAIANASRARLTNGGVDVQGAQVAIPFPVPHNGNEAIWNHILRWRGFGASRDTVTAITTPTGDYSLQRHIERIFFPYDIPGAANTDKVDSMFWTETAAPPRIAGQITLAVSYQDPVEQPRAAWQYYPGERRVRRAPQIAYDTPYDNADGLVTIDDYDMFNGAIDRYDWKLLGREELYVPYNTNKFQDPKYKYSDLIKRDAVNPDAVRWELHRVWKVEATLKPAFSHIYSRRTLYLDEDSWTILISDRYDRHGQLWRTGMAMGEQFPDVPGYLPDGYVMMDLVQHRYFVLGMHNEEKAPNYAVLFHASDFTPEALRRYGVR